MHNVFCILGPTASGKTALALALVTHFPFEIISVDSAMIYREMSIGTAKPTSEELALAPHYLIDILDPPESFSAAEFCQSAVKLCKEIIQRNKIPLLVGGTMMYFNALQQGLSNLPEADEKLRNKLFEEGQQKGWHNLHAKLQKIDAISAEKIHPNDTQRIQRALEVFYLTGKPLSNLLLEQKKELDFSYINILLLPENRAWLHERIEIRFKSMLTLGFINEVEALLSKWDLSPMMPAMRCVGYRQAVNYLNGIDDYQGFIDKGLAATRQLAKRQLTWLRQWPQGVAVSCDTPNYYSKIVAIIQEILDNTAHN